MFSVSFSGKNSLMRVAGVEEKSLFEEGHWCCWMEMKPGRRLTMVACWGKPLRVLSAWAVARPVVLVQQAVAVFVVYIGGLV